jgi:hypothetical protein
MIRTETKANKGYGTKSFILRDAMGCVAKTARHA